MGIFQSCSLFSAKFPLCVTVSPPQLCKETLSREVERGNFIRKRSIMERELWITYFGSALGRDLWMSIINRRNDCSKKNLFQCSYGHLIIVLRHSHRHVPHTLQQPHMHLTVSKITHMAGSLIYCILHRLQASHPVKSEWPLTCIPPAVILSLLWHPHVSPVPSSRLSTRTWHSHKWPALLSHVLTRQSCVSSSSLTHS